MKKNMFLLFMLFTGIVLLAQSTGESTNGFVHDMFGSITGMALGVTVIFQFIKDKFLNTTKDWILWLASLFVSIGLVFVGHIGNLGIFGSMSVADLIVAGFDVTVIASGIFKVPVVRPVFNAVKLNQSKIKKS